MFLWLLTEKWKCVFSFLNYNQSGFQGWSSDCLFYSLVWSDQQEPGISGWGQPTLISKEATGFTPSCWTVAENRLAELTHPSCTRDWWQVMLNRRFEMQIPFIICVQPEEEEKAHKSVLGWSFWMWVFIYLQSCPVSLQEVTGTATPDCTDKSLPFLYIGLPLLFPQLCAFPRGKRTVFFLFSHAAEEVMLWKQYG
jgi:hypothetical protein